jgi:hypothetical protein
MTARARRILGAVVLTALLGPLVVDWLWVTDEERVVATLDAMEKALEARDAAAATSWFSSSVTTKRPLPGLSPRVPLKEGLAPLLERLEKLAIDREDTQVVFPERGKAAVTISGTFFIQVREGGLPFKFRLEATLGEEGERWLLESVDSFSYGLLAG